MSNTPVIGVLNGVLTSELTAINQYFLHARILKHMGLMQLADHEYKKSIDQMRYTDMLVERILTLGGLPNLQTLEKLAIGQSASEIVACDLRLSKAAEARLREAVQACEKAGDVESAGMLKRMLASDAEHHHFLLSHANMKG